jgi:tight adherence protein C
MSVLPWAAVAAWVATAAVAGGAARDARRRAAAQHRLTRMRPRPAPPAGEPKTGRAPWDALAGRIGRMVASPARRRIWQARLGQAGWTGTPEGFLGRVVLLSTAAAGLALLLFGVWRVPWSRAGVGAGVVGVLVAVLLPVHLRTLAERRRARLLEELPDVFDFLAVSMAAGLTFDATLAHVVPQLEGVAQAELKRVLDDMRVGMTRREALDALANRTGLLELERLATLIAQAETLGRSLSEALRAEAARMRGARLLAARTRAGRLPVRMTFPIVLFLFPALYVILLGPALLDLLHAVGGHP